MNIHGIYIIQIQHGAFNDNCIAKYIICTYLYLFNDQKHLIVLDNLM